MHCPRCGTLATPGQQFCRSCGLNIEQVAALIAPVMATAETPGSEIARLKGLQLKHESWGVIAGLISFGLILVLMIALVFTLMIVKGGILILPGSILILLAVGAGIMGYFQASAKLLRQKLAEPKLPQPTGQLLTEQSSSPSTAFPAPVSVTEQTTKLLPDQNHRATQAN